MKKLFFICWLCVSVSAALFAQSPPAFDQVKLKKNRDFKAAQPIVQQTADYLLSTPIDKDTARRLHSAEFLMKWMEGTNDYTFTLTENTTKYYSNDINLMAVYIAALCKAAIAEKPNIDTKKLDINAVKILLGYAGNTANDVKWTKDLKDLADANNNGELESFLTL
jgi:hypothetical protein